MTDNRDELLALAACQPGDHIVIEGSMYDSYVVCRVVKVGKTMWEVEQLNWRGEYDRPVKRKVVVFMLYRGNDPAALAETLKRRREEFAAQERERKRKYHASIAALPGLAHQQKDQTAP